MKRTTLRKLEAAATAKLTGVPFPSVYAVRCRDPLVEQKQNPLI